MGGLSADFAKVRPFKLTINRECKMKYRPYGLFNTKEALDEWIEHIQYRASIRNKAMQDSGLDKLWGSKNIKEVN